MTISRAQMPRQLYEAGSLPADVEEIIQNIMEMTGISREEAIRIIQTMENPKETMDDATMIQEGYELEPRQQYGLGSIVKSVTRAVKKVAESPIGKAALLYTGAAGLGALGTGSGFAGFTSSIFSPATVAKNLALSGKGFLTGVSGGALQFPGAAVASNAPGAFKLGSLLSGKTAAIGGASLLAGAFASPQEAQELFTSDRSAFTGRLRQYAKNLNPDATDEQIDALVAANTPTDVSSFEKLYRTKLGREVTGDTFAQGGRVGLQDGSNPFNEKISIVNPLGFDVSINAIDRGSTLSNLALALSEKDKQGIMQALDPTISYSARNIGGVKGLDFNTFANMRDKGFGLNYSTQFGGPKGPSLMDFINNDSNPESGFGKGGVDLDALANDFGYSDGTSSASDGGEAGADAASSAGANDGPDTGGSFAQGGIPSIPMGELRKNAQGVQELDYRQDGGFVPVGIKEKADDVPAMLSKNEFVMTADAVRGMGNGNIENGAQKMYNLMKSLENRMA